jgi:hypothetical protein
MAPRCDGSNEVRVEPTRANVPARLSSVPCPVRVLTRTLTLRRGRHSARLPILCPRGCGFCDGETLVFGLHTSDAAGDHPDVRWPVAEVSPGESAT